MVDHHAAQVARLRCERERASDGGFACVRMGVCGRVQVKHAHAGHASLVHFRTGTAACSCLDTRESHTTTTRALTLLLMHILGLQMLCLNSKAWKGHALCWTCFGQERIIAQGTQKLGCSMAGFRSCRLLMHASTPREHMAEGYLHSKISEQRGIERPLQAKPSQAKPSQTKPSQVSKTTHTQPEPCRFFRVSSSTVLITNVFIIIAAATSFGASLAPMTFLGLQGPRSLSTKLATLTHTHTHTYTHTRTCPSPWSITGARHTAHTAGAALACTSWLKACGVGGYRSGCCARSSLRALLATLTKARPC